MFNWLKRLFGLDQQNCGCPVGECILDQGVLPMVDCCDTVEECDCCEEPAAEEAVINFTTFTNPLLQCTFLGMLGDDIGDVCISPSHVVELSAYHENVSKLAYQKWEAADKPEGQSEKFWLEAECELHSQVAI